MSRVVAHFIVVDDRSISGFIVVSSLLVACGPSVSFGKELLQLPLSWWSQVRDWGLKKYL